MIFILSHNGLILDANEAALAKYEYNHTQVFGMGFENLLVQPDHITKARKLFESVKNGAEIDYEWMTQTQSGRKIPVDVRLRSLSLSNSEEKSAVVLILRDISLKKKADETISSLARATNIMEFDAFLKESVRSLAQLYNTKFAFVGRLHPDKKHVTTLVVWAGDRFVDNFTYSLEGTPCLDVLNLKVELIPNNASERYPDDEMLIQMGIQSYFGQPMIADGKMMGLISVMDEDRLDVEEWTSPVLGLYANRLAVEIERFEINQELQKNKENLEVLVEQRTSELAAANNDLEAFNSSIAHDLRTPINAISSYCQILHAECGI
jgi:PAS domain S-box-containing protein